jgi:hypothetical protein
VPKPAQPVQPAGDAGAEKAEAAPAPAPEPPKCPPDVGAVLTGKAKAGKDRKKRIKLELAAKGGAPSITWRKELKSDDGNVEDVKVEGSTLSAQLTGYGRGKMKLTTSVTCGWEDRLLGITVDARSLAVTLKELPPPPEPGYLNVVAEPGAKVTASGRELGLAPLRNVPLPPGRYQVTVQPKKGKAKTVGVEIKSAQYSSVELDPKKK